MQTSVKILALMGALVIAGPASAQIVNGNNGGANGNPAAPIGTKAGGSSAAMDAPGEADAAAGAHANAMNDRTGTSALAPDPAAMQTSGKHRHRAAASATTSDQ